MSASPSAPSPYIAAATASPLDLDLPAGWLQERLCNVTELRTSNVDKKSADGEQAVKLCNYVDVYYHDKIRSEIAFMDATATTAQIENFTLRKGDVVMTKDSETPDDIGIPALVAEDIPDLVCGYHLTILRAFPDVMIGEYLFYALSSRISAYQFYLAANGVTRFGLTYQGTKNLKITYPEDKKHQKRIALFLDWKTGRIDALIARKKKLIEKLTEKRVAIVTHAVSEGINPAAPLNDSGTTWLGKVPLHWEVKRLRFLIEAIDQGWSPSASNAPAEGDELGVLKLSAVSAGRFVPEENKMLKEIPESQAIQTPRKHDLLVTRANTPERVGDACVVQDNYPQLIIPDLIYRLTVDRSQSNEGFISYFLLSKKGRAQIEADARGSSGSMVKLGQGHLKNFRIPSPPVEEQQKIRKYLDEQTGRIDGLMKKINDAIARLTEYRTAIITAATTGKIDVRGVKIPQPAQS